jgi:hypothetical protein
MATNEWYAVWYLPAATGKFSDPQSTYAVIQAPSATVAKNKVSQLKGQNVILQNVEGPYSTRNDAVNAAKHQLAKIHKSEQAGTLPNLNPASWLQSMGGFIASGLESGFIAIIKDLWAVVIGPLEVIIGAIICMFVLTVYFKDDLFAATRLIGLGML